MVIKRISKHGAYFSAYFFSIVLLKATWWINWKFGTPTLDQIIFHLQTGNEGLNEADPRVLDSFIKHVLLLPLIFSLILYSIQQLLFTNASSNIINRLKASGNHKVISQSLASLLMLCRVAFGRYVPIILLLTAAFIFGNKVALWTYIRNLQMDEFIDNNYIEPNDIKAPKKKLNLVLIYLESFENGFGDSTAMGRNLLEPLENVTLLEGALGFSRLTQSYGTGWTIAGIVATQCGIPLKAHTIFDGNTQGEKVRSFLPGAKCLGDILLEQGYRNVFLGGASLYFSGKGKFLSQHGYSELYGKEEWARTRKREFNDWGLFDDQLLKEARSKLDQLQKSKQPFNLTLLTVDTHFPDGFYSPTCRKLGFDDYKGIVSCTSSMVADFISYMSHKGYLKNTVVVITGDHLAMEIPVTNELEISKNRTIFNRFITPIKIEKNRDTIYHFSMLPTILYAMGFQFDRNRLGLGASGFGNISPDFSLEILDSTKFNELLAKSSKRYTRFLKSGQQ